MGVGGGRLRHCGACDARECWVGWGVVLCVVVLLGRCGVSDARLLVVQGRSVTERLVGFGGRAPGLMLLLTKAAIRKSGLLKGN